MLHGRSRGITDSPPGRIDTGDPCILGRQCACLSCHCAAFPGTLLPTDLYINTRITSSWIAILFFNRGASHGAPSSPPGRADIYRPFALPGIRTAHLICEMLNDEVLDGARLLSQQVRTAFLPECKVLTRSRALPSLLSV